MIKNPYSIFGKSTTNPSIKREEKNPKHEKKTDRKQESNTKTKKMVTQ